MNGTAILIVLFLIALFGFLLYLRSKSKRTDSTPPPTSPAYISKSEPKEPSPFRPDVPPEAPKHNTVYAYVASQAAITCPYCDGENPPYSQTCCICGNFLKR